MYTNQGIIGVGRNQKNQAISTFDNLARIEAQQNIARQNMEAAEDAQRSQTLGMAGAIGADYGYRAYKANAATQAAAQEFAAQGVQQTANVGQAIGGQNIAAAEASMAQLGGQKAAEVGAQKVGEAAIQKVGEQAVAQSVGTGAATGGAAGAAGAGGAAGAAGGAAGSAAAGTGAAASSGTGVLGAMGPVGWVALAGLLAISLF